MMPTRTPRAGRAGRGGGVTRGLGIRARGATKAEQRLTQATTHHMEER